MIKINNLEKYYNKGKENEVHALKNVNIEVEKGEMVGIIGRSGSGKSTLLHILGCIDEFQSGEYSFDDKDVSKLSEKGKAMLRNSQIGIVLQDFALIEECNAIENVMIPLHFSKGKKNKKYLALDALKKVGMIDLANKKVSQMSGGQKQRVAIARAIVNDPLLILADEPTGALDVKTSAEIIELLKSLNEQGTTIIIITHDIGIAKQCGRCLRIEDGVVEERSDL